MILDAHAITIYQSCPRRYLLSLDYEPLQWRPRELLNACLREGVLAISQGKDAGIVAELSSTRFLQEAANPGLDLPRGTNTYVVAKDYAAMLSTILRATQPIAHLPVLSPSTAAPLSPTKQWLPLAMVDEGGVLHRVTTTDRVDDAWMARELHSWYVFGDVAATRREMVIHVVEIGQQRDGRRASAWARGWKHPAMSALRMRFVKKGGEGFSKWSPVYLADNSSRSHEDWAQQLVAEGVAGTLIKEIRVAVPPSRVCDDTVAQVLAEGIRMKRLVDERGSSSWRTQPMHRAACDSNASGAGCPFQYCCHSAGSDTLNPADSGMFRERMAPALETNRVR